MKKIVVILAGCLFLSSLALLPWQNTNATHGTQESPSGEILILNGNMQEVHNQADVNDQADMAVFANRVKKLLPYAPDVLLLQEVDSTTAQNIADQLNNELYGGSVVYEVARSFKTPRKVYEEDRFGNLTNVIHHADEAVLINTNTMEKILGSKVTHQWFEKQFNDSSKNYDYKKDDAVAQLKEISSGKIVSVASVHVPHNKYIYANDNDAEPGGEGIDIKRKLMIQDTADKLNALGGDIKVISGDFNTGGRCGFELTDVTCNGGADTKPYWAEITGPSYQYKDVIYEVHGKNEAALKRQYAKGMTYGNWRLDIIFVNGAEITEASTDVSYHAEESNANSFYSDHRFNWVLLQDN
jgi:hypothetical protein